MKTFHKTLFSFPLLILFFALSVDKVLGHSENNLLCLLGFCGGLNDLVTLATKVQGLEKRLERVAFFAYKSGNIGCRSMRNGQTLVYDKVDLNIGNGYNKNTGTFKAPSDGLYLFHTNTGVYFKSYAVVNLVHNGVVKDISLSDSALTGHALLRNHGITSTPILMKEGDVVSARLWACGGSHIESGNWIRTSFSGVKIN